MSAPAPPRPSPAAEAILQDLNPEQLGAVTHGEGPLLIVAGAGTGKTEVITKRIAWLIATKRARPEEILALTFTDKAAIEMESRVDLLVPYGYVGATISTFHAFCDRLVREHAVELGLTSQLRVETPAEILVFLRERLFELPLKRYLPLGNPDAHLRNLVALFDRARDEDVSAEAYQAFAERLAAEAASDEDRDRAESEREKALAYGAYQKLLLEHGRVDFGSQISLALRLLRERPWLEREIQERYRFVLVDEFQDTNHVQFELVKRLGGGRRNVTVVGDDDQSIYRFRGARVENLLGFLEAFPSARTVVLRRNYRSGQRILDLAHRLIQENNPERLEARMRFDKRLIAERGIEAEVEHRPYATGSDEAEAVAEEIATAIAEKRHAGRDIAVLARAHSSLDPFAQALRARGVRFRRVGMRGLYSRPEVQLCLNVLRVLADPGEDAATYMVLGDPLFAADPVDLAELGAAARRRHRPMLQLAIEAAGRRDGVTTQTREAVTRFAELHRRLAERAVNRPTSEVLFEFVEASGLLARIAGEDSPEAVEEAQNLNRLFGIVKRVGPLLKHDRVDQFMHHLDLLIEMGDDPVAAIVESEEDAVHLLTAHNAKGLEFPVVYLVHVVEGRFPRFFREDSLPLPPELRSAGGNAAEDHNREERRLFYVGMTRARDRLILTQASDYGGRMSWKPSRFLLEALGLPAPAKGGAPASALESIRRFAPIAEPPAPEIVPIPDDQPLTVSNRQIDDWLSCPLLYRYAHVQHVPLPTDPRAMYGIAIHHAIRVFLQHRMKGLPIEPEDVIAAFESAWTSDGFISREHEERRLDEGREALRRFVEREMKGEIPVAIERDFRFKVGTTIVVGRWDRIDQRREGVALVDYKTSVIDEPGKADEIARRSLRDGQLGLYALAYREMYGAAPARAELQFVGSAVAGTANVEPRHLESALERIHRAADGIRAADFAATPAVMTCMRCAYSKFCLHSAVRSAG